MFIHSARRHSSSFHLAAILVLASAANRTWADEANGAYNDRFLAHPSATDAAHQARKVAAELVNSTKSPGLTVAVAVNGELVWSEAFGDSNRDSSTPTTRDTEFNIGSVSKLFTVAALAKLYESGRIDLDAGIQTYVRDYPNNDKRITPRRLAGHLAGIRHYNGMSEILSQQHCTRTNEALAIFQNDPLLNEPGSRYLYSSFGFVLLGAAIEEAANQPFMTFVNDEFLRPLKLSHTRTPVRTGEKKLSRTGEYWLVRGDTIVSFDPADVSCRLPAGGLISTAEDLARFAAAHVHGRFLKPETEKMLFASQRLPDGKETGVGLGWRIGRDENGRTFVHHGGTGGGRAFVLLYPSQDVAVSLCSNLANAAFAENEAQAIAKPFLATRP